MDWYNQSIEKIFKQLHTGDGGLNDVDAKNILAKIGNNELQEGKKKTALGILLAQFKDLMILILLAAAVISGVLGDIKDTIFILVIVLLNATVGFIQEYRAEKAMQALKKMAITPATVVREGNNISVAATELVPGDIVILETGNAVPADIRVIESVNLKIDESALTGESETVEKFSEALSINNASISEQNSMLFKGTFVSYGRGKGIVVTTGMQTQLGNIAKMLQQEESKSPLQQRMISFSKKLSLLVLLLCILFFFIGWLRGENLLKMLLTSISLAVAAIPEALPAVITISLALAAKRLIKLNSLIKKLPAVETLGSVTYICTDKTGTLTKNKMYVEQLFVNNQLIEIKEVATIKSEQNIALLLQSFALNNDTIEDEQKNLKGDSTEIALMQFAKEQGVIIDTWPRLAELAFDSKRKLMTTFHKHNDAIISFTKGAPDILIEKCKDIDKIKLQQQVNTMAESGYRVIGFAYRNWSELPQEITAATHENDLQFIGLAGIIDPPREEVTAALAQCKTAGIVTVMITGDHPLTAKTIAKRIGILNNENDLVITGKELADLSETSFLNQIENIKVYARVSPEQKLLIVKTLQQKGHYVAMTGDGVNDAPSLKLANIGIAMGITGTDVSKEAAHMILLDDNFSTIVKAVREGRRVYDNILKFIKYLMTTNSGELWILLIGPILGLPIALLPIHILWINLISDGLPAISLSFEKAEKNIMKRLPRNPKENVFANGNGLHMIWVGLFMAAVALLAQNWAIQNGLHWQTIVFNIICLSQMGHVLAIRSNKQSFFSVPLFSNIPLILAVASAVILQIAVTYIPVLHSVFKTKTLSLREFIFVVIASSLVFFAVEIEKFICRKKKKHQSGNSKLHET
jgi:Ca2+-transporting ATPase